MKNIFIVLVFLFGIIFSTELVLNSESNDITNRDECVQFENEDECLAAEGCEWISDSPDGVNGMCVEFNGDWWDNECSGLTQDECIENEYCDWSTVTTPNGIFEICIEIDSDGGWDNECSGLGYEECEALDFCEWISDSPDGANGMCVEFNDDWWDNECFGLGYEECETLDFCEWVSDNNDPTSNGFCVDAGNDWFDCDPDLACATVITCYEGLLYPTSCGPENCDEPIGECDDYYEGCQSDNGQWYDLGQEIFINDCEYYECTLNGWEGPFSLDNDDCSDSNDFECSDLTQDECMLSEECVWSSYVTPDGFYEGCIDADDGGDWECSDLDYENCEWFVDECVWTDNGCQDANWEDSCNGLTQDECEWSDDCEWISDSDNPNNWGYCVEIDDDNDGPPDCLDDCEGIQDIDPSENPYEACDWIISNFGPNNFFNECAEDCDEEILMEINEIVEACYECLENQDFDCADVFDDDQDEECSELNYPDCMDAEGCEWVIINEWGGYSCVEIDENNNCYDLNNEECIDDPNCEPNYNAAGQFEGCEEVNYQDNFGLLYGSVDYVYGDYVDFVPYAPVFIESYPSNSDMYYFQTMADGEGYYQIELPPGSYMVTAYANEDSLTLDIVITPNSENELNFLMGEWGGNGGPDAVLSLDTAQGVPGDMISIPLYLSSNESVAGIQFTLESGTPNVQGVLIPSGIESIDPCFSAQFNNLDNQFLAIIFSMEGCSYPPEEMLHIADLVYSISDDAPFGMEVPLYFSDTIVSDTSGNEIYSFGVDSFVLIGMQGDVNGDGELNVLDIVMIVNFALYLDEPTEQQFWASDINGDNLINILDIVQVVNMILDR